MTPQPSPDMPSAGGVQFDTPRVMRAVRQTRNWIRFLGVFMLLGAVLWLVMIGFAVRDAVRFDMVQQLISVALVSFAIIGMGLIPVILMLRFSSRCTGFLRTGSPQAMVDSLAAQRHLWTLLGIYLIVYIAIIIVAAILIALAAIALG